MAQLMYVLSCPGCLLVVCSCSALVFLPCPGGHVSGDGLHGPRVRISLGLALLVALRHAFGVGPDENPQTPSLRGVFACLTVSHCIPTYLRVHMGKYC